MTGRPVSTLFELRPPSLVSFETVRLDRQGAVVERLSCQAQLTVQDLGGGVSLELVEIPAGSFQMGSRHEGGYEDELPVHIVFLASFWMGKYPVTQAQWQQVMGRLPDCRFHGPQLPVDTVCWADAQDFCRQLSKRTGQRYTLPAEAQWEYACRAGSATPFSFGETITTEYVNFVGDHTYREAPAGIYRHGTTPVGSFPPNPWGLCDMHGNMWEFCADPWREDYTGATADGNPRLVAAEPPAQRGGWLARLLEGHSPPPAARGQPGSPQFRVARGGSWHEPPAHCRSAMRLKVSVDERLEFYGLRVMLLNDSV